jgi:uncharacterized protein with PIN domain
MKGYKRFNSNDEFEKFIKEKWNNEYEFQEQYKDMKTKIILKHNLCGYEWKITPSNFINNNVKCPLCNKKVYNKTTDFFKQEVSLITNNEYKVLSEYKGNKNKVLMKHIKCQNEFLMQPNAFLNGQRCPYCSGKMQKTTEQFKKEIYELVGDEYELLDEYINSKVKVHILHKKCKNIIELKPNSFLTGHRCGYCSQKKQKNTEWFKQEVYDLVANEYEVLGEYTRALEKTLFRHNKCEYEFLLRPNDFLKGTRCPKCNGGIKNKSTEYFKNEVYNLTGDEYVVVGTYKSSKKPILFKHVSCGNLFSMTPGGFLGSKNRIGNRCPICNESKGEQRINKYFTNHNLYFIRQKEFDGLLGLSNKNLSYDFYLPQYNLLIEYQGEQHGRYIKGMHKSKKDFEKQQEHDRRKCEYAKEHNIKLLEIWYWDYDNIEDILQKELNMAV